MTLQTQKGQSLAYDEEAILERSKAQHNSDQLVFRRASILECHWGSRCRPYVSITIQGREYAYYS